MPQDIKNPPHVPDMGLKSWEPHEFNAHLAAEQKRQGKPRNIPPVKLGNSHAITDVEPELVEPAEANAASRNPKAPRGKPKDGAMVQPLSPKDLE